MFLLGFLTGIAISALFALIELIAVVRTNKTLGTIVEQRVASQVAKKPQVVEPHMPEAEESRIKAMLGIEHDTSDYV